MEKRQLCTGEVVKSLAGHDEGRLYVVVAIASPDFVLLSDGLKRKLDNPKLKRLKHLQVIGKIDSTDKLTDVKIKRQIKLIKNQNV